MAKCTCTKGLRGVRRPTSATVRVEGATAGSRWYFRLTMPDGSRESVPGDVWNRKTASAALDLLESVYGFDRRRVRFDVH